MDDGKLRQRKQPTEDSSADTLNNSNNNSNSSDGHGQPEGKSPSKPNVDQLKKKQRQEQKQQSIAPEDKYKLTQELIYDRDWMDDLAVTTTLPPTLISHSSFNHSLAQHMKDAIFRYDTKTMAWIVGLTVVALLSRFYNIDEADFVVWDEAHFGGFPNTHTHTHTHRDGLTAHQI